MLYWAMNLTENTDLMNVRKERHFSNYLRGARLSNYNFKSLSVIAFYLANNFQLFL